MGKSPKKPKKPRNDWESNSDSGRSSLDLEEVRRKATTSARRSRSGNTQSSGLGSERNTSDEPMEIDEFGFNFGAGQANPQLHEDVRARLLDKGKKDGFGRDAHVLEELAGWLEATQRRKTGINLIEVALMLRGANEIYKSQMQTTKKSFQELLNHCTAAGAENEENPDIVHVEKKKPKKGDKRKNQDQETVNPDLGTNGAGSVVPPNIDGVGDHPQDNLQTPFDQANISVNPDPGPSGIFPDTITSVIDVPSSSGLEQQQENNQTPDENVLPGPSSNETATAATASASIPDSGIGSGGLSQLGFSTPARSQTLSQDSGFGDFTPSVNGTDPSSALPDGLVRSLASEFEVAAQEEETVQMPVRRHRQKLVMPPRDPKESIRQCAVNVGEIIRAQLEIRRVLPKRSSKLPMLRACFDTMSQCSNTSSISMPCLSIQGSPAHTIEDLTSGIPDHSLFIPIDEIPMNTTENAEKPGTSLVPLLNEINGASELPSTSAGVVAFSGTNLSSGLLSEAKQTLFNNLSRNLQIMFHQLLFDNLPQYQRTAFLRDIQLDILKMKDAANLSPVLCNTRGSDVISCDDVLQSLLAGAKVYVQNLVNVDCLLDSRTQLFAPMAQANPHQAVVHLIPKESAADWRAPSPIQEKVVKRFSPRIPLEYTFRCEALLTEALRKIIAAANRASTVEIDIGLLEQTLVAVMKRSENDPFTVLRLLQSATASCRSPRIATGCFFAMLQLLENKTLKLHEVGIHTRTIDSRSQVVHFINFTGVQTTGGAFAQRTNRM